MKKVVSAFRRMLVGAVAYASAVPVIYILFGIFSYAGSSVVPGDNPLLVRFAENFIPMVVGMALCGMVVGYLYHLVFK